MDRMAVLAAQVGRRQDGLNSLAFTAALTSGFQPRGLWLSASPSSPHDTVLASRQSSGGPGPARCGERSVRTSAASARSRRVGGPAARRERLCPRQPTAVDRENEPRSGAAQRGGGDREGEGLTYETLEVVEGYTLLRTDRNGWIELSTDGERMWVEVDKR
jgi:hypothetical protein